MFQRVLAVWLCFVSTCSLMCHAQNIEDFDSIQLATLKNSRGMVVKLRTTGLR